jgi:hypothetical protein
MGAISSDTAELCSRQLPWRARNHSWQVAEQQPARRANTGSCSGHLLALLMLLCGSRQLTHNAAAAQSLRHICTLGLAR